MGDADRVSYFSMQSYNVRSGITQLRHICTYFRLLSSICMRLGCIAPHKLTYTATHMLLTR